MEKLIAAGLACFALVGCEISTEGSEEFETSEMDADFTVRNEGGELGVTVTLKTGNSSELIFLLTEGGDQLEASFNGETATIEPKGLFHHATFPMNTGTMTFDFHRDNHTPAAATLRIPEQLTVTSPTEGQAFDYSDGTVTFDFEGVDVATASSISWRVKCVSDTASEERIGNYSESLENPPVAISLTDIFANGPQLLDFPDGCDVTLELGQETFGTASEVFRSVDVQTDIRTPVTIRVSP